MSGALPATIHRVPSPATRGVDRPKPGECGVAGPGEAGVMAASVADTNDTDTACTPKCLRAVASRNRMIAAGDDSVGTGGRACDAGKAVSLPLLLTSRSLLCTEADDDDASLDRPTSPAPPPSAMCRPSGVGPPSTLPVASGASVSCRSRSPHAQSRMDSEASDSTASSDSKASAWRVTRDVASLRRMARRTSHQVDR